jgi:Fungalysin metallopeptidase (M36)
MTRSHRLSGGMPFPLPMIPHCAACGSRRAFLSTGTPPLPGVTMSVNSLLIVSSPKFSCMIQVFSQENWEGQNSYIDNYRPDAGKDMVFNFTYNPKFTNSSDAQSEAQKYINATVAQLFYTTNMVHDLYYRYLTPFANQKALSNSMMQFQIRFRRSLRQLPAIQLWAWRARERRCYRECPRRFRVQQRELHDTT